jgi:hypothetical protein
MINGILEFPILPYYFAVRRARKIDGWLFNGEARFLFSAARLVEPPNVIVEIGAWHGKSTVLLCGGSHVGHRVPVYSFDLFEIGGNDAAIYTQHTGGKNLQYFDIWKKNVRRTRGADLVTPIVGCSWENAGQVKQKIGLLFIDGDHTEDGVRRDWQAFGSHLAENAMILFHDYLNQSAGVRKVVDEIRTGWNFGIMNCSAVLWRPVIP